MRACVYCYAKNRIQIKFSYPKSFLSEKQVNDGKVDIPETDDFE